MKKKTSKSNKKPLALLEPLLQDEAVSEIMIDSPDRVLVERNRKLVDSGVKFKSAAELRETIDAVLALGGEKFSPGQTVTDTRLSDGSRVLAVLPPTAVDSPYLIIRKFYTAGMTWEKLFEYKAISREAYELLQGAMRSFQNILVTGGAGSGKTTVLNLLAESIPPEERVIVVGERADLPVNHPRRIHLEPNRQSGLSLKDLFITAARMHPERIVSTEFLGEEAIHALQIASRGHDGSLMSIHAINVEDALARLEGMCLMANIGLGIAEIRALIASTFGVITCQRRMSNGSRKMTEITELRGLDHDRYVLQPLMRYNVETEEFEMMSVKPSWK